MLYPILAILFGFVALVISADKFIAGAASMAFHWGMSKLLIGLTIVAFGTSAPEILVSLFAALEGSGNIAVGNAIGSNLANIGMVLGFTALMAAIPIHSTLIAREIPILLVVTFLSGIVLMDFSITLLDSLVLFAGLGLFMLYLIKQQQSSYNDSLASEEDEELEELTQLSMPSALAHFILGLAVLLISADTLVWGAKEIALYFGVSELIIGLTVIAIGTSLPELAASVSSAMKGHHEIAFGNVIGSNIFNLLVVMGVPGLVMNTTVEKEAFFRDYASMTLLTSLWVILMAISMSRKQDFSRLFGAILLAAYGLYYVVLFTA